MTGETFMSEISVCNWKNNKNTADQQSASIRSESEQPNRECPILAEPLLEKWPTLPFAYQPQCAKG